MCRQAIVIKQFEIWW